MNEQEHEHQGDGADACMITTAEAAGVADVSERTIRAWASAGWLPKYTKGPAGYWVRFCREEVRAAGAGWRRAETVGASAAGP